MRVIRTWLQCGGPDMNWRWIALMILFGSAAVNADPDPDPTLRDADQVIDFPIAPRTAEWLVEKRDKWSKDINVMAVNIDRFFAGDAAQEANESFVRLRGGAIFSPGGSIGSDSAIKLKLDLPGSKKRWKLIFESDPDEFSDLETQTRSRPTTNRKFTDTGSSTGAVRFVVDEKSKWKQDFDLGIYSSIPLDPFARYQLRRTAKLGVDWSMYFKESIYYFNQDGFGQKTSLSFEKPINDHYLWRNRVDAKFSDDDNVLQTAFVTSTVHVLDDRRAMEYAVGVLVSNRPVSQTTVYFINATYRKRLFRDWLFFDIRPEIAFGRGYEEVAPGVSIKHGFTFQPSLTLGFDAYLWQ